MNLDHSDEAFLQSLTATVMSNSSAVYRFGAQVVVLRRFLEVALPCLTTSQCAEIATSFRSGIEDAMGYTDDIPVPTEYHTTLLKQTNILLTVLNIKSKARG